jgi:hypothetical protein
MIFESGKRVNKGWDSKPVPAPKSKTISVLPAITSNFASVDVIGFLRMEI